MLDALPPNISLYSSMNASNISAYSSPYARLDWQIAQILWVGYFSVTAYLFLALCFYLIRLEIPQCYWEVVI